MYSARLLDGPRAPNGRSCEAVFADPLWSISVSRTGAVVVVVNGHVGVGVSCRPGTATYSLNPGTWC